jgi:hypothetical protein
MTDGTCGLPIINVRNRFLGKPARRKTSSIARAQFAGYSIGKWVDEDGDGRYDTLLVETRGLKNPRTYDAAGIPFHEDGLTITGLWSAHST